MQISTSDSIKISNVKHEDLIVVINKIIADPFLKSKIEKLRSLSNAEEKRQYKIDKLPYFCPGLFENNYRRKDNLHEIGIMILDIDHMQLDKLTEMKASLQKDEDVAFSFVSPSGDGLKIAVAFDQLITDPYEYEKVFQAYTALFSVKYDVTIDMHGSDCSRACFLSHDPDLYQNDNNKQINVAEWLATYEMMIQNDEATSIIAPTDRSYKLAEAIDLIIAYNNENGNIYNDYRSWQIMGLALASLGEAGREHFLALSLGNTHYADTEEAINTEFDKLLKYYAQTTKNPVSIGTIFYIAKQHGFVLKKDGQEDGPLIQPDVTKEKPNEKQEKDYWEVLAEIKALPSEAAREKAIVTLAEKLSVKEKSIRTDLKTLTNSMANQTTSENVLLVHPSYDVRTDMLILGFRQTVIVGDRPEDRNFFIVADTNGRYQVIKENMFQFGDYKVVLDMRSRDLVRFDDRWSREGLDKFLAAPEAPTDLYNKIKSILKTFIECQKEEHYGLIAAWIIATYFNRCFTGFPYLFFYGKKQTAKSRGLVIIEHSALNAVKVKGSSIASFIDTIDGLRGVFCTDQAELLSDKKYSELISYHTDSYIVDGGKKRLVSITNGIRKVLEFEAFSPKAYAAQKDIDPDLRDRCITINMIRAKKTYMYPAANLPIWAELRHDLYRLLLTKWQDVMKISKEVGNDMTLRVRELWIPIITILTLENVPVAEINKIKNEFKEIMLVNQDHLSEKEYALVDALLTLAESKKDDPNGVILSSLDIANQITTNPQSLTDLGFISIKALTTWIGKNIVKLALSSGRHKNPKVRQHSHMFHYNHIKDIKDRFESDMGIVNN